MRIGLFLESSAEVGGGFQQALSTIDALTRSQTGAHQLVVLTPHKSIVDAFKKRGIEAIQFRSSLLSRALDRASATRGGGIFLRGLRRLGLRRLGRHFDAFLDKHKIDLVWFSETSELALCLSDHHFVFTVWDTCHRDWLEFPEVYSAREFEIREHRYRSLLPRAVAVIADSAAGAARIAELYGVDRKRIVELPFLPSLDVRARAGKVQNNEIDEVRRRFGLRAPYVFYPAQFWSHKNHLYLLEGLKELENRHGIQLDAVFVGHDKGNADLVRRQAVALGIAPRVHMLGHVSGGDLATLYAGAVALVMPTYFGPTNIPPLEAGLLSCPVIYSDFPEFREQMGDGALYCDLSDPASLAGHLAALVGDNGVRQQLIESGRKRAAESLGVDYGKNLAHVVDLYAERRRRYSWPED
jgi:glycosyltransferase involved in cell wall biosynthesis